jgi:pteridine reductase
MDPRGKVALVTGGAHRVGKTIALALALAGADVAVNYASSAEEAAVTVAEVEALGVRGVAVHADVADHDQVCAMVKTVEGELGQIGILVNGASLFRKTPFPTADMDTWRQVTRILIDGAFFVSNAVAPGMLDRGSGAIINIVDLSAWEPWRNFTAHAVGKSGLLALTRQLALELAPTVRVNAVAPGPVLPPPGASEATIRAGAGQTLLGRWGEAEDVAQAVMYLVTADYVTGEVITVDGGQRHARGR